MVSTLNGHMPRAEQPLCAAPAVEPCGVQLPCPYRYMMERLEDKVAAMQARMEAAVAAAKAALGSAWSDPVPVGTPVQVGPAYCLCGNHSENGGKSLVSSICS